MRRLIAAGVALLFSALAWATTTVGPLDPAAGTWRAYRGSGYATLVCSAKSEAAMFACAAADAEKRKATTRYQYRYPNRYGNVTYSAPPPPVDCVVSAWSAWDGGAWSQCTGGTQTRQETRSRTVVTQPANGGAACPALTETRTASKDCAIPGTVTLNWTTPTQPNPVTGYRIVYGRTAAELVNAVQIGPASSYALTGLADGTWYVAVIVISGGNEAQSNTIKVTLPPDQVATITWPAAPTAALFTDPLAGKYAAAQHGIAWSNVNARRGSVASSADGLVFNFDPVRDAWAEQRLTLPNMLDVWMQFEIFIPANYFHPNPSGLANNNKFFLAIWGGDYGDPSTPGMDVNLWPKATGESEGTVYFFPPFKHDWSAIPNSILKADYGKWVTYTLHAFAGTPAANGGLQIWKGSTKICDTRQAPYRAGQRGYDQAYLFGWANSGYSQPTAFKLRNVVIADRNRFGVQ